MLAASAERIERSLTPEATVLDVGGGALPFARADWVLDLMPYEQRGALGWNGDPGQERFRPETWISRDICDREPWPFETGQFDFAVCSHTLEDVRDPVWVCQELQRVARAGYIEVPALLEELTFGIQGPWVGWGHHRWLVFAQPGRIEFLFKHHVVNRAESHLPEGSLRGSAADQRVQVMFWEGRFAARERFLLSAVELDGFLEGYVREVRGVHPSGGSARTGSRALAGLRAAVNQRRRPRRR